MKKILFLLILTVLFGKITVNALEISASSAIVIDMETGETLFEKNSDEKREMASTTKIMTAICGIEQGNLSDIVSVSEHAADIEGSSMYLKKGEKISLENLLYGLMLVSGNDAATAIAEHISGNEENFAKLMNETAKKIGVESTNFENPHGLSSEKHYTTARDLARITAYGMKNSYFSEIVKTANKTIVRNGNENYVLVNHNKLLKMYDNCIGVKTGFTKAAGRCLVSAWEKDNIKIVCVTLNASDDWNDHKKMSDSVFSKYKNVIYGKSGTLVKTIRVKNGELENLELIFDKDIILPEREKGEWSIFYDIPKSVFAPIKHGQTIGRVVAVNKKGDKKYFEVSASKSILKRRMWKSEKTDKSVFWQWLKIFC